MASVRPIPTACPLTAAMTGFRTSHAGKATGSALKSGSSRRAKVSAPAAMSAPTQNALPAPVRTTARTSSRPSHSR